VSAEIERWVPDAPRALREALDTRRSALEPLIRSEIFGPQRFAQHGRSLGLTHRAAVRNKKFVTFFPRVRDNIRRLREAHRYIGEQATSGYDISPAAEWLLDNFHLIEAQLRAVREGLPWGYFRHLPVLLDEPLSGLPRVYGIAWAYIAHSDSAFNISSLVNFLIAYQETRELNLRELWALPTTLRVVLVENLRRVAERVATSKAARELANVCCDHIDAYSISTLNGLLDHLNSLGVAKDFLGQIAQRFQDQRTMSTTAGAKSQYAAWLHEKLPDSAAVLVQLPADQAANNLTVSNAVTSLRAIGDANWMDIVVQTNPVTQRLLAMPLFEAEHPQTRDQTLHQIERLATRSGKSEIVVVDTLLALIRAQPKTNAADATPRHWIAGDGKPKLLAELGISAWRGQPWSRWLHQMVLPIYLLALVVTTYVIVRWAWAYTQDPLSTWLGILVALLLTLPASETVVAIVSRLISESARPTLLPRLAFSQGIPAEHRVLVVIPAMLIDAKSIHALARRLYLHHLANPEDSAQFALLTDWCDSATESAAGDAELLSATIARLNELNRTFSLTQTARVNSNAESLSQSHSRFILLHRVRRYSQSEQCWMGWERKRGKLEMLVETTTAANEGVSASSQPLGFVDLGDLSKVAPGTHYIVTLDSDTELPPGRLRDLVGVAAHPLNQPQLNSSGTRVVSGYGILQPRVATPLSSKSERTPYHWLFAGQCGVDPYSAASSEVYQDLFDEGSFTGKGLLNVGAMHAVLSRRLPEAQVLSHDLLEGALARCATVTDITLIEEAPFHADVAASRIHRWTRGDWQLLPILGTSLSWATRFPLGGVNRWKLFDNLRRSLVAPASLMLLLLAIGGIGIPPLVAFGLIYVAFCAGPVIGAIAAFSPSSDDIAKRYFFKQATIDLIRALLGGVWQVVMLLQHAVLSADAIVRALFRTFISRRKLLQWTTAAVAQAQATTSLSSLIRKHAFTALIAVALMVGFVWLGGANLAFAVVFCATWTFAPLWTWLVSAPGSNDGRTTISVDDQTYLLGVARDTWRYFERSVGEGDNYLPPDNLQTLPHDMLAHRTSPTNIGLYLLSCACARQFDWITTDHLLSRLDATRETLSRLQRYRGHFLNWYDTQTCLPLFPMYVSTVDSGNLSAHLLTVAQSCAALALTIESHDAGATQTDASAATQIRQIERLRFLAQDLERLAWEADYSFLYDPKRHLFHIGFRLAEQQLDSGYYDLLASESRLTSLLAIAKGDVPAQHWAALGRPFYAVGAHAGLRSWSGSMFEYLMPSLVVAEPDGSALSEACMAAIHEQIAYGNNHHVPWGISESAYAARDESLAYQYAPQGVPRLALRRTPPNELVIAPYATALAAQLNPKAAVRNFSKLEALIPHGEYGFIDAVDFSVSRQERQGVSQSFTPVSTYMAHHQGMTLVAITNVLFDGIVQRWGMANAHIEAVSSLLHERAPRELPSLDSVVTDVSLQSLQRRMPGLLRQVAPVSMGLNPTHLLSNGRYRVTLRANGSGTSSWGQYGISRWRDDALRDMHGHFIHLRWTSDKSKTKRNALAKFDALTTEPLRSITLRPAPDPGATYTSTFHSDRVCFDASWSSVRSHMTVWVSPEDDIEFRQVELTNSTDESIEIEIVSAFDVTLAHFRADEAHPAFSNLFIKATWRNDCQAIVFERTPRLSTERGAHLGHFVAESDCTILSIRGQADRARWIGRNHDVTSPEGDLDLLQAQLLDSMFATGSARGNDDKSEGRVLDTWLDPVCVLAVRVRIGPMAKARITLATAAAADEGTLSAVIDKYRQTNQVERSSLMSATLSGIRLRTLRISPEKLAAIQTMSTVLLQSVMRPPATGTRIAIVNSSVCDRSLLWRFGISGDRPIILVSASSTDGVGLIRALAQAMSLWSWGGVACDLVILNAEPTSYHMALQHEITLLRERFVASGTFNASEGATDSQINISVTGFHVLRVEDVSPELLSTLQRLARLNLHADGRSLQHQVLDWNGWFEKTHERRRNTRSKRIVRSIAGGFSDADANNLTSLPNGKFATESGDFSFAVNSMTRPKKPWVNVLSNAKFGAQLSEAGGGFTWATNSRLNQLTAWSNDAVADPPCEWFLLQDVRTGFVWSVSASHVGASANVTYEVKHGQGFSVIRHQLNDLEVRATWTVDTNAAAKYIHIELTNHGTKTLHIRVIGIVEWMMGESRVDRNTISTRAYHEALNEFSQSDAAETVPLRLNLTALFATQNERSAGFGEGTAFFSIINASNHHVNALRGGDWTCDRSEFFDDSGQLVVPDRFGQNSGEGLDPCAALSARSTVAPSESSTTTLVIGYADSFQSAKVLALSTARKSIKTCEEEVRAQWSNFLDAVTVVTPDPLFDVMVNRWLLYQAVACRLWAKAGFYQAGGATGFRDQLQDAMALAWAAPDRLRQQIILCSSRQFFEGDVQHWWHMPSGAGVRTHFSDDLLWLPFACLHYLKATDDAAILEELVPYLDAAPIPKSAEDVYAIPAVTHIETTVFEHCARAIDKSLPVGSHGLPLIGTGDWNDGMNRVGNLGQGESVWLGWFLCDIMPGFGVLARARGETARADTWDYAVAALRLSLVGNAWDGQWFKRAFFDNGDALGSHANAEGRIDLVAQTWSVLSDAAPIDMQRRAMAAVDDKLIDRQAGLIRLLDPPLHDAMPNAGYIQAYPPGVRENGGQYSHAGVWAVMAAAKVAVANPEDVALSDRAYEYFTYLSPAHRTQNLKWGERYGIEPYVMAGDVYSQPPYVGVGGWSWYTGAAAWMHRAAIESIFGLKMTAKELFFSPCLPSHWPRAELTLKRGEMKMRFIFCRATANDISKYDEFQNARLLLCAEHLQWSAIVGSATFFIPLI
jgi:cyclic beta-1,2-glucan synthetase